MNYNIGLKQQEKGNQLTISNTRGRFADQLPEKFGVHKRRC